MICRTPLPSQDRCHSREAPTLCIVCNPNRPGEPNHGARCTVGGSSVQRLRQVRHKSAKVPEFLSFSCSVVSSDHLTFSNAELVVRFAPALFPSMYARASPGTLQKTPENQMLRYPFACRCARVPGPNLAEQKPKSTKTDIYILASYCTKRIRRRDFPAAIRSNFGSRLCNDVWSF